MEAAGNAYDPVLEQHIGKIVVVEMDRGGTPEYYQGILKEYTAKYLELVNAVYYFRSELSLPDCGDNPDSPLSLATIIERTDKTQPVLLEVTNISAADVVLTSFKWSGREEKIGRRLKPDE